MNGISPLAFQLGAQRGLEAQGASPKGAALPFADQGSGNVVEFKIPEPVKHPEPAMIPSGQGGDVPTTFGHLVQQSIIEVNRAQKDAGAKIRDVLQGGSTSIHEAMIASQKASISFQILAEMRNKVLESYKEIMRMQV